MGLLAKKTPYWGENSRGLGMVALAGVQPATFALGVRCSMQLSYKAIL